jgi:hypothetical protein
MTEHRRRIGSTLLLLRIRGLPGSVLGLETDCPDGGFPLFFQVNGVSHHPTAASFRVIINSPIIVD